MLDTDKPQRLFLQFQVIVAQFQLMMQHPYITCVIACKKNTLFFVTWCICYWKKSLPFALLWHCIEEAKGMLEGQIVPIKWRAIEFKAALADLHLGDETFSSSCHSCVFLQLLWKNKSFSETDLKACASLCKGKEKWPSSQLNTQKWLLLIEV